jgi:hypothetical protein
MKYFEEIDDTFKTIEIGGYAAYSSQYNTDLLSIYFPYGEATGKDQPNGQIIIYDNTGGDASLYLDDPIVRAIIESVKITSTETGSPSSSQIFEQIAESMLSKLGSSLEELTPDGVSKTDIGGAEGDFTIITFFFDPDAEVDAGAVAAGIITIFRDGADGQKIYDVYKLREDPGNKVEVKVEDKARQLSKDYADFTHGSADFGLFSEGTMMLVYMDFGMVAADGEEARPVVTMNIQER